MQTVQGTLSSKLVTTHAVFLANVSRHFVSLEIEPMLEAVGRSALCILGDICVVDRVWGVNPTRILEVRATPDAWMEAPADLVAVTRAECASTADARGSACRSERAPTVTARSVSRRAMGAVTAPPTSRSRRSWANGWRSPFATYGSTRS